MRSLLYFLLLTVNCVATATSPPSQPRLRYSFDLRDPAHIHVSLDLANPAPGPQLLLLPSQWAGQTELYHAIANLRSNTPGASLEPTPDPARWLLHHPHPGPVNLTYDLAQDWSGPLKPPFEHRALLGLSLFEFNGQTGLVTPALPEAANVDVRFDLTGLPPGQAIVTSFGTAVHQHFVGPWSSVRNALFTGGEFRIVPIDVDHRPVILAMHGAWTFEPDEIAAQVRQILRTERHLWNDTAIPFYAVVIAPYEGTASGGGGSGFTNIFNLFLAEQQTFNADTASLFAHEAFHHWNPSGLGAVPGSENLAWFGEGFTRFYQDTTLERAGIIGKREYLARLNTTIRDYRLSPRIHVTNADLDRAPTSNHLADPIADQQPYLRGAMIALWLSSEISRQSSGRHTLTDLLFDLRADHAQPLTADRIFRTAGRFVDADTVDRLRQFALDGVTVPIQPAALGECVTFSDQPAWAFHLGFDPSSLRPAGVLHNVEPGSNAERAGLHDGQQVDGFQLWSGNPDREVTLTLRDPDGKRQRLTFLPRGKLLLVPQAELLPACPAGPRIPQ